MENIDEGTYKWDGNLLTLSCGCKMEFDSNHTLTWLNLTTANFIPKLNFIKRIMIYHESQY